MLCYFVLSGDERKAAPLNTRKERPLEGVFFVPPPPPIYTHIGLGLGKEGI